MSDAPSVGLLKRIDWTRPDTSASHVGVRLGRNPGSVSARLWWLDAATVYALGLALIASVYIGFAVADRKERYGGLG